MLYVGRSRRFGDRMDAHQANAAWWNDVVIITLEDFGSDDELAAAEAFAIASEDPIHNVARARAHRRRPSSAATARRNLLAWLGEMHEIGAGMSTEDRSELERWEDEKVDGSGEFGTSDWPGWERLGLRPCPAP